VTTSTTIDWAAADKGGMTLGELHQFVVECEEAGAVDSTRIEADLTWGGKLKKVRVVVVRSRDGMIRPAGQEG
jgi:hypothetical protein